MYEIYVKYMCMCTCMYACICTYLSIFYLLIVSVFCFGFDQRMVI